MEVVIEHREPTHRDPENVRKFLQSMFDPFLTVHPLAEQPGAAHAARNAVVPARNEGVDQVHACDRHGYCSPPGMPQITTARRTVSRTQCLSSGILWAQLYPLLEYRWGRLQSRVRLGAAHRSRWRHTATRYSLYVQRSRS